MSIFFKLCKYFFLKDGNGDKDEIVKMAGDRGERLLLQRGLTYKSLFEMIEDVNYVDGLEELFLKMNEILMPLLLIDVGKYEEVREYLIEKALCKRLESALYHSTDLEQALFRYKGDIVKRLENYKLKQDKLLGESNIVDKFLLQRFCKKSNSVKRKNFFKGGRKVKRRRNKLCRYMKQGFCRYGTSCKFRHKS